MKRILSLQELEKEAFEGWMNAAGHLTRLPHRARLRRWYWKRSEQRWQRSLDQVKLLRRHAA